MIVRKLSEAKPYEAPNHRKYESLRIFGAEMGGSQTLVFGISHFQPGGGAGPDASPPEKIYHILDGELTVIAGGKESVARKGDTVFIAPNENREIVNRSSGVCTLLVAVAAPASK
jgi:quercetin dioxygenase-like cupin family protein